MSGASRVFLARLAGTSVFDPLGDQVGRIRDAVVSVRNPPNPPRVLGLVVEVQGRRRVFIPMGRVTSIDPDAVIISGVINVQRFIQRPGEKLAIAEMLDHRVRRIEDGEMVTLSDLAMEQSRTRDWIISRVAISEGPQGRLRRRQQVSVLDWNAVDGFAATGTEQQGTANLLAALEKLRPADLANVVADLPVKRRTEVVAALNDERLADVLEEMSEDDQVEILGLLEGERAADVLEEMAPDDAADLLGELPPEEQERLLALMEPEESEDVRRLLSYDNYTAGGMMNPVPVVITPDATVAEALARIRNEDLTPALASQVYVCRAPTSTPTGRFLGIAHFQRLLREPPSALVAGVIDTDTDPVDPELPLAELTRYFATYNLVAVPVVDDTSHLLGVVTVDDVLDHLLPEDWREDRSTDPPRLVPSGSLNG